jgi:hypothetical protein
MHYSVIVWNLPEELCARLKTKLAALTDVYGSLHPNPLWARRQVPLSVASFQTFPAHLGAGCSHHEVNLNMVNLLPTR